MSYELVKLFNLSKFSLVIIYTPSRNGDVLNSEQLSQITG